MLPWIFVLAVVAAPICEEFIFRALLYRGLRRSFGTWRAAIASALLFAIVHPAIGSAPVFVLGLTAALVYERSRFLAAPVVTHMVYNALILAIGL